MAADTPTTQRQARYGISIDTFFSAHQALLEKTRASQTDTASFEASLNELKDKIASATPAKHELPYNCTMIYPWLFGNAIPDSRQQIDHAVELLGIRAIVTLTPCPLTSTRIFIVPSTTVETTQFCSIHPQICWKVWISDPMYRCITFPWSMLALPPKNRHKCSWVYARRQERRVEQFWSIAGQVLDELFACWN